MSVFLSQAVNIESAHGNSDVDSEISVVSKKLSYGGVEHQTVGVHDG